MSRREMQYVHVCLYVHVCCMSDENITPIDLACDKGKTSYDRDAHMDKPV